MDMAVQETGCTIEMTVPESTSSAAVNQPPPHWIYQVLKHTTWRERAIVNILCKRWHETLSESKFYWKFMCTILAEENGLYFPDNVDDIVDDWKKLFFEYFALHKSESDQFSAADNQMFAVKVCARFRPKVSTAGGSNTDETNQMTLPLHQRVQLVKAAQGPQCTTSEAMKIIMTERGRPPVDDPFQDAAVRSNDQGSVSRPSGASHVKESVRGVEHKVQVLEVNQDKGTVLTVAQGVGLREFQFEKVFDLEARQHVVYSHSSQRMVMDLINGYNGAVIVYGQTGSGKTHTMFGPDEASVCQGDHSAQRTAGVVPRACEEVLQAMAHRRETLNIDATLHMSYIEVFGGEMLDLLQEGQVVGQSRVAGQRYVLDGGASEEVRSMEEVRALLARGEQHKRRAATAMNERSSRAHAVVVLSLTQQQPGSPAAATSSLFLADLGGSEKLSKSKVDEGTKAAGTTTWEEYYESHERVQEAANINVGLFALKKCIDALNDRQRAAEDGRPPPYIPYQDSKLTMLLSGALGGNSKCAVLITASLENSNALETLQTLRFGERCANVENTTALTAAALRAQLEALDAEVAAVEAAIEHKERWEMTAQMRPDIVDGKVVGHERIMVSQLVGAEEERLRLEKLLKKRRELLGELVEEPAEGTGLEAEGPAARDPDMHPDEPDQDLQEDKENHRQTAQQEAKGNGLAPEPGPKVDAQQIESLIESLDEI